jgi:hypothetical protein
MDSWIQIGLQVVATVGAIAAGYAKISSRLTAMETRQQLAETSIKLAILEAIGKHQRDCPAAQDAWLTPSAVRRNPLGVP